MGWSRRGLHAALLVGASLVGCQPPCIDADLDERGSGCALGPDCDDTNAARGEDCEAVPPPDCEADPTETGCLCLAGTSVECFPGDDLAIDVGTCRAGRARCVAGHLGLCVGAVSPRYEICDGQDQDCDGRSDEGALSPCGGCDGACGGGVWGGPSSPFDPALGTPGDALELTDLGELTLARRVESTGTVWVPSSADATISRIDETTLTEVARYAAGAAEPSRVAIDGQGDAWIACRAFDGQSTLIEIAGSPERCIDADDDGAIETSHGPTEILPFGTDECVLRSIEVGAAREVARALAIDGDRGLDEISGGDLWVGLHDGQAVEEIDGATGALLQRIPTPGFSPYAAAFDPYGTLYLASRDGQLARIDRRTDPPSLEVLEVPLPCWLLYSMAIDREGRVALSGFSCDRATLFDPRRGSYVGVATEPSPRGVALGGDGDLYVAHTGAWISRLSLSPLRVLDGVDLSLTEPAPTETIGIGVGRFVWAISRESGPGTPGVATAIDPETLEVRAAIEVGLGPHTQGDLTGIQRFDVAREGSLRHRFEGCAGGDTTWIALHADAELGTDGRVLLETRHGASTGELEAAPFATLATLGEADPPFALALPPGGIVEVQVTLRAGARFGGPRLTRIGLEWSCPGPD